MIRRSRPAAALLAAVCLAGCAVKGTTYGSGGFSVGNTQGDILTRNGRVVAVLWVDDNAGSGSSAGHDSFGGELRTRAGRAISWEVVLASGGAGMARIDGKSYGLAAGALFLISTRGGAVRVRQLDLPRPVAEADGFDAARDKLVELAATDADLAAFVGSAAWAK
jgi:hypothetical protein